MTEATELKEVVEKIEYEEWKDEYEKAIQGYIEPIRVAHDTSTSGCVGYISSKSSQIKIGSFRVEALGDAIPKAVDIVQIAMRQSKEIWRSGDILEIEDINTSTERGEKANISKISILLSKHSFIIARKLLEQLIHLDEFNPREIIFLLKDTCRIRILEYLEILSEDNVLRNYFRYLRELLASSRDKKGLAQNIRKERNQFKTIDPATVRGFAQGIYDLYGVIEVVDVFLAVRNTESMITLESAIESYYRKIAKPERYTKTIYDKIKEISESMKKFRDAENPYYKLYYLSEARIILEDINGIVGSRFVEPFKTIYLFIFDKWRNILNESREKTRINPEIRIMPEYELKSEEGIAIIKIILENIGLVEIVNIRLKIFEKENLRVIDENPKEFNMLLPNRKSVVYFKISMAKEGVRIGYVLKYSTQGKNFEKKDSFPIFPDDTHREFKKIPNPYILGRCLKPGKGGVFVGREDIFRSIEQDFERSAKAMVFVIHGLRRTGKTSLLHYLPEKIRVKREFIYVDMQLRRENNISDFLNAIIGIISKKVDMKPQNSRKVQNNPYAVFEDFLERAAKKSKNGIVLMFDEFELLDKKIKDKNSDIDEGILDFFRGIIHKEDRLTLMFVGTFDESKISTKWKILFNVGFRISLSSLRESEARFLIENPVREYVLYSDISRDRLIDLSGRNPYYLQGLCSMMVDLLNRKRVNYARVEDVEEIQNEAIDALVYNYSHFWENLSILEKKVCKTLAKIQSKEYDVTSRDIKDDMDDEIGREEVENIVEDLFRREILEKYSQDIPRYRFAVELLAHQINKFGRY